MYTIFWNVVKAVLGEKLLNASIRKGDVCKINA